MNVFCYHMLIRRERMVFPSGYLQIRGMASLLLALVTTESRNEAMWPKARAPLILFFSALPFPRLVAATRYNMIKGYSGPTFFDGWSFPDQIEADILDNADSFFVPSSIAASSKLAFVDPATKHAFIKVDNTCVVPFNEKRDTVRITTKERYGLGSIWVADIFQVPYGCSVWPAWWSLAPNWPARGEIDTLEGVNLASHTESGCTMVSPSQATLSITNSTDCSTTANNNSNQGCAVTDGRPATYGPAFATTGGGVWVTVSLERHLDLVLPACGLGTPAGNWPSTGCQMEKYFAPQNLIFDIKFCGTRPPAAFLQTCSGICYNDYVLGNGSNYGTVFWEVGSVRVYKINETAKAPSHVTPGTTATTGESSASVGAPDANSGGVETAEHSIKEALISLALGGVAVMI
ncbi:hypothetical protein D9615_003073 [Tricholomella constricta]|uniref:GH16 domain-containing protein n=1 Tax=Tricholomella constricta TaxID=117010 RepID=A0A8H5HG79_9AGAR|nr:hypothetical protein D9615_003073 [Tricholomella constricta]